MTWGKLLVGKYKGAVPREPLPSHHLLSSTASMSLGFSVHLKVLWFEYRHGLEVLIQWPLFGGSVRRIELLDPRPRGRRELEESSGTPVTPWRVHSAFSVRSVRKATLGPDDEQCDQIREKPRLSPGWRGCIWGRRNWVLVDKKIQPDRITGGGDDLPRSSSTLLDHAEPGSMMDKQPPIVCAATV